MALPGCSGCGNTKSFSVALRDNDLNFLSRCISTSLVHRPIAPMTFREVHMPVVAGSEKPDEFILEVDGTPLEAESLTNAAAFQSPTPPWI